MADRPVEPFAVAQMVEAYATDQYRDAEKYSNRELLDESGIYDLHALAGRIYALGFNEGCSVEGWRKHEQRQRIKTRAVPEGEDHSG
jgi:hypothetical protein